jgi:hypothetical protein
MAPRRRQPTFCFFDGISPGLCLRIGFRQLEERTWDSETGVKPRGIDDPAGAGAALRTGAKSCQLATPWAPWRPCQEPGPGLGVSGGRAAWYWEKGLRSSPCPGE